MAAAIPEFAWGAEDLRASVLRENDVRVPGQIMWKFKEEVYRPIENVTAADDEAQHDQTACSLQQRQGSLGAQRI